MSVYDCEELSKFLGITIDELMYIKINSEKCHGGKCEHLDIFHHYSTSWDTAFCQIANCNCTYSL